MTVGNCVGRFVGRKDGVVVGALVGYTRWGVLKHAFG